MLRVKQMVQHYERMTPRMSKDLQLFLDVVWSHRHNPNLDIYELYGRMPSVHQQWMKKQRVDRQTVLRFLRELGSIPCQPLMIQGSAELRELIKYRGFSTTLGDFVQRKKPLTIDQLSKLCLKAGNDWLVYELSRALFHYGSYSIRSCLRIYLHVFPAFLVDVFCWVINQLVDSHEHLFCCRAKVTGPYWSRSDTIVIYLLNEKGMEKALLAIANYQKAPLTRRKFSPELPRLTKPVFKVASQTVQGIGIGYSPPYLELGENDVGEVIYHAKRGTSFGATRARIIALALSRVLRGMGQKEQFLEETLYLMKSLGIDPLFPYLQLDRDWYNSPYMPDTRVTENYDC